MNTQDKMLARHFFKMKILLSEGMTFQDLVVQILSYAEHDFIPIKAWGNIGDRKNDGCIPSKGVYYQIYAPENLNNTYIKLLRKIRNDFTGLLEHYKLSAVKKYYFIVNDKYAGVHPDSFGVIEELKNENNLKDANILCAKDLENILFALGDDEIYEVVGAFPDPSAIQLMDYSILTEVLQHIMQQSIKPSAVANYVVPDWDEKIKFNNLTEGTKHLLKGAMIHVGSLDEYLKNNSDFVAETLRDHLQNVYYDKADNMTGDELFHAMLNELSPRHVKTVQDTVLIIMAKYFETCDIFEDPHKEK